ncbi:MAG TPA: J domain-containing protein [Candidatus Desulfofervidus auxilii]|uniref:J domain-containing protein n=1 Tax=Desulfofervidus auxilii TaxID=1621989 RepID=A0A7C0U3J3_DESA2|nr:J domain-containing protein [Candidatus Desulfofervidus auxilii]
MNKKEFTYEDLTWAREVLGIPLRATQAEIKQAYRRKIKKWHPDRCNKEVAHKKMAEINRAYEIITSYCRRYKYSFDLETFRRNMVGTEWWWWDKFGQDPIWSNKVKK